MKTWQGIRLMCETKIANDKMFTEAEARTLAAKEHFTANDLDPILRRNGIPYAIIINGKSHGILADPNTITPSTRYA
jgi:hypothetical protein